jgi:hypothetical protein
VAGAAEGAQVAHGVGPTSGLGLDVVDLEAIGRGAVGAAMAVPFEHSLSRGLRETAVGLLVPSEGKASCVFRASGAEGGLAAVQAWALHRCGCPWTR